MRPELSTPLSSTFPAACRRGARSLLIAIVAASSSAALARDPDQNLRDELAQLKRRIEAIEARLASPKTTHAEVASQQHIDPLTLVPASMPLAGGATEQRQTGLLEPGELPLNPTSKTYWRVPGTETDVRFSGMIRLGASKDLIDNLGSYKFRSGDIHPIGDPRRNQVGNIQAQLKLSRISFDTETSTRLGDLRTTLSVDFAGAEPRTYQAEALQQNGFHLRLMHAFAALKPFRLFGASSELLIGQTWSNFLDDPDTAESIDPSGPAGVPSERQPQVRYTARFGRHAVSLAVENPMGEYQLSGSAVASSVYNTSTTNRWPDFSAKYETEQPWGRAQLSAVLRLFDIDDGLGHRATATGYGVIAGGTLNLLTTDRLGGQFWFGDGIGKFVPDDFGNANGFAVAYAGTDLVAVRAQRSYGGSIWYRHYWARDWRSNIALGYAGQRYADFIVPSSDQAPEIKTAQVNLIYVPIPMLDLGVELQYGRKTFRPELGLKEADALRLGFTSRIKFN